MRGSKVQSIIDLIPHGQEQLLVVRSGAKFFGRGTGCTIFVDQVKDIEESLHLFLGLRAQLTEGAGFPVKVVDDRLEAVRVKVEEVGA